jgi:hypothetical protein
LSFSKALSTIKLKLTELNYSLRALFDMAAMRHILCAFREEHVRKAKREARISGLGSLKGSADETTPEVAFDVKKVKVRSCFVCV